MIARLFAAIARRHTMRRLAFWADEINDLERERRNWTARMAYALDESAKCRRALSWRAANPATVREVAQRSEAGAGIALADGVKRFSLITERNLPK